MTSSAAKHAELVVESALPFLVGEFAVLSEFVGKIGLLERSGGTGARRLGLGVIVGRRFRRVG
jgi:hypothetical protein